MDKYDMLKIEYADLSDFVEAHIKSFDKNELMLYVVSGALKIWSGNKLYSPDYADALTAVSGEMYSIEQIVTAMSCCGDSERQLKIPAFFKALVIKDKAEGTAYSRSFIEKLGSIFVSTASINGDFTMEEANELSGIVDKLKDYSVAQGLPFDSLNMNISNKVTATNEDSYLRRIDSIDPSPTPEPVESGNSTPEPITITVKLKFSGMENAGIGEYAANSQNDLASAVNKPKPEVNENTLETLLAELNSLVGLETVKRDVHSLMNFIKIAKVRESRGMKVPVISYHLVFTGNPGTGKTTVARLVAQLYYHMGILPQGQLVETDRSALVAGYLGQTAIKTQKVISQALGGVLFIDEAYSLAGETDDSYGREAVETILKAMEDHRNELVVIVAGYDELMHKFIDSNPGLASRFSKYFHFPDYDGDELLKIFLRFCSSNGFTIDNDVSDILSARFTEMFNTREEHFGNARAIRNIFEKAISCQANRIAHLTSFSDSDLEMITSADIDAAMKGV